MGGLLSRIPVVRNTRPALFFLGFYRLTEHNFPIGVYSCSSQRAPGSSPYSLGLPLQEWRAFGLNFLLTHTHTEREKEREKGSAGLNHTQHLENELPDAFTGAAKQYLVFIATLKLLQYIWKYESQFRRHLTFDN